MVRAAAKNFAWVGAVIDPSDYASIIAELEAKQGLSWVTRRQLAEKVFVETARYDAMIHAYFIKKADKDASPNHMVLQLEKAFNLRYGENPHQKAVAYQFTEQKSGILSARQQQGKPLSYNNLLDADSAWSVMREFAEPTCVIVKHTNPCGVASGNNIDEAYLRAYHADSSSAFGGIIALNRPCTKAIAEAIASVFMELVIAPDYTPESLSILSSKPNLRVLQMPKPMYQPWEMTFITGGVLMQEQDADVLVATDLKVVTEVTPTEAQIQTMLFAWRVLKHVKSNAILIATDHQTVGIGVGQVSRVDAVDLAVRKAGDKIHSTVLASDAFFPFKDSIDRLANTGVRAIIQPGGSMRDEEVITACNERGLAMVFTGKRCFKH
jgi:phosphoribosylaminoimidazolecarboxamide formyltransferase/IMP cyclohydrolase